jgi:hypothetical protein
LTGTFIPLIVPLISRPSSQGYRPNGVLMTPIIQSLLTVLGAFFVVAMLVGLTTALAADLMLGSAGPGAEPTTPFLVVNLTYSVLYAIVGGYLATTVSDHAPLGHTADLSVFMMLLGLSTWVINGGDPASWKLTLSPEREGIIVVKQSIEFVFFEGCPNVDMARANLRSAVQSAGEERTWKEWDLGPDATPKHLRSHGSPTVLIDGHDIG